jgi:hypothetical protein
MLTLIAALAIAQKMPDTSLRLKVGDAWTAETTYHYTSEDVDLANVETTKFSVIREGKREILVAQWQVKETWVDDERIPVPPGVKPVVRKIALDGEDLNPPEGQDVARHRIERAITIERKGNVAEPSFFPVPPNVRLVGIKKIVELDPRVKEQPVVAVSFQETGGDLPMKGIGYYSFEPVSGILKSGSWTIQNSPLPGGEKPCELLVTLEVKDLKLAPRK